MTRTSPTHTPASQSVTSMVKRVVIVLFGLLPSLVFAQAGAALPETPKQPRRVEFSPLVMLAETPAAEPVTPASAEPVDTVAPAKTPITRPSESESPAVRSRSQYTMWGMLGGLVILSGGLAWWTRRGGQQTDWKIPGTVFQVLGKNPVTPQQSVVLCRLGERLLLVSSTPTGLQTLAVVTDPAEVAAMTAECLSRRTPHLGRNLPRQKASNGEYEPAVAGSIRAGRPVTPAARRALQESGHE